MVLVNLEDLGVDGAEFFILVCMKAMHLVQEDALRDAWNELIERGDEVVEGLYYKQQGQKQNSYVLLQDSRVARLYLHLVCATKFTLNLAPHKQKDGFSVYQLSNYALRHICDIVQSKKQRDELDIEDEEQQSDDSCEEGSDLSSDSGSSDSSY